MCLGSRRWDSRSVPLFWVVNRPFSTPIRNEGFKSLDQNRKRTILTLMVLSAKVRRKEQLWHTLDIGNIFGPTFGFKNSQKYQSKE